MQVHQLIKKSIILVAIFLTLFGLIFPTAVAIAEQDGEDGVWLDEFDDANGVELTNCTFDNEEGKIILVNGTTSEKVYDFKDGKPHRAYRYVTQLRNLWKHFPPNSHVIFEHKLLDWTGEIDGLKEKDYDAYTYSSELSYGRYIVHHFSFKIDADVEDIEKLEVTWRGKAKNDDKVEICYWSYYSSRKLLGSWNVLGDITSNNQWKEETFEIPKSDFPYSINALGFVDICVVIYPDQEGSCSLSTDYISLKYTTITGYTLNNGYVITKDPIDPSIISNTSNFYWDILTWNDYEVGNAKIKYQLLYNKNGNWTEVEEKYLKGNEKGFNTPPVSINSIPSKEPYDELKIKANLSTDELELTPKLSSWAITWQKNRLKWKDLFNYNFRVDKSKVNVIDGNISIDPITGDWPMFGQNPQNTRSTTAEGPKEFNRNWWCQIGEDEHEMTNQVIIDGMLFTTYKFSSSIYVINDISETPLGDRYYINYDSEIDLSSFGTDFLVNSPTVTEDKIIIATGNEDPQGSKNYIIAINRANEGIEWFYEYPENICYSSTPLVYNDKVYVTSWSGDPDLLQSNQNNKVITLDLNTGSPIWEVDLPAKCVSTPAAYNNTIYVGCNNKNGESLFAINAETGESIWNQSIGMINKASPVLYNDTVFIVSKCSVRNNIKLTALDADNGTILRKQNIMKSLLAHADTTPAIFNDVLYLASPNGKVLAYDVDNLNAPKWTNKVYSRGIGGKFLLTSPAYSNGVVYIGTPNGRFYALDASDGKNINDWSDFRTFRRVKVEDQWIIVNGQPPIVTSPIVSNGLVFFGDDNGKIYSLGEFKEPTDQKIEGSVVSIPIKLPTGYWWDKFYASTNTSDNNKITFSILDENKKFLKNINHKDALTADNSILERTVRLRADLSAKNSSVNPQLKDWEITFVEDSYKPVFKGKTFSPDPQGWINRIISELSVDVYDNITGLKVSSAEYDLEYSKGDGTQIKTGIKAICSGVNGTKDVQTITANISSLSFFENITDLFGINISIYDLAGNKAYLYKEIHLDNIKPTSYIRNDNILSEYNAMNEFVEIYSVTRDPGISGINASGIKQVELKYRFSSNKDFSGSWDKFEIKNTSAPKWKFTPVEQSGFYELISVATDNAGNKEDEREEGDVTFFYDQEPPEIPSFPTYRWFNSTPTFSYEFSDDYLLDSIEYRPNFDTTWTTIASDINEQTYDSSWSISDEYWNFMEEGEKYYLFFRVTDSVGNIVVNEEINNALEFSKDISKPIVDIEIPDIEAEWTWDEVFKITVFADDRNGSKIQTIELWYRYSEDNENWSEWKLYEGETTSSPFIKADWEFNASDGNGYYEFKIRAEDEAGNFAESEVFATGVNIFPVAYVSAMIALVVVLVLILLFFIIFWKIKNK